MAGRYNLSTCAASWGMSQPVGNALEIIYYHSLMHSAPSVYIVHSAQSVKGFTRDVEAFLKRPPLHVTKIWPFFLYLGSFLKKYFDIPSSTVTCAKDSGSPICLDHILGLWKGRRSSQDRNIMATPSITFGLAARGPNGLTQIECHSTGIIPNGCNWRYRIGP